MHVSRRLGSHVPRANEGVHEGKSRSKQKPHGDELRIGLIHNPTHYKGRNVGRCDWRSICHASSICEARFKSVQRFSYVPKIKHVTCISIGPSNIMSSLSQIFVQLPPVSGSGGISSHLFNGHFEETIRIAVVRNNDPRSWRQATCQVFQRYFMGVALFATPRICSPHPIPFHEPDVSVTICWSHVFGRIPYLAHAALRW